MGAQIALLASSVLQYDAMDDAEEKQRREAEVKRQALLKQQKIALANKRANKYAKGFVGRTFEQSLNNVKNNHESRAGAIYGGSDNTLGKINLLTKTISPFVKGTK